MRVSLLKTMKTNYREDALFPALDGLGKIVFNGDENRNKTLINVDAIEFCEEINNRVNVLFYIKDLPKSAWELTFTEYRMTFWTSYVASLLGNKAKLKEGSVSAGHIKYGNVAGIRISNPQNDWPFICVFCLRADGTAENFLIKADRKILSQITQALAQHIESFWSQSNIQSAELAKELLNLKTFNWDIFSGKEHLINLCYAPVQKIQNSLLSAEL